MILYFSATGNSEYAAKRIAVETGDIAVSITDCYKKQIFSFDEKCKTLGIVSPTYSWGLPVIVTEFLQRLDVSHKPDYIFFIATYGTTPGQTGRFADNILAPKGLPLSAKFSVKMPDTWTPIFDLSNKEKVQRINDHAELEIDHIIEQIKNLVVGDFMKNKLPYPLAKIGYHIEYDSMRKTKHFSVEDTCVGCGLCAKNCPVSAIKLKNRKPEWMKEQCVMCLACLHHCRELLGNKLPEHLNQGGIPPFSGWVHATTTARFSAMQLLLLFGAVSVRLRTAVSFFRMRKDIFSGY